MVDRAREAYFDELFFEGCQSHGWSLAYADGRGIENPETWPLAKMALRSLNRRAPGRSKDPMPWLAATLMMAQLVDKQGGAVAVEAAACLAVQVDAT